MIEKLVKLIESEDKKNPLTDGELAKLLGTSREKVNELRMLAGIPNHLKRREDAIKKVIDEILTENPEISFRKLTHLLNEKGIKISTFGLQRYKEYINEKRYSELNSSVTNRTYKNAATDDDSDFPNLIGIYGSLQQVIKHAKAAVLYPPNGLHTLIVGETGTGKTQLVYYMHMLAKKVRKKPSMPLVTLNCADYSDNPQLLVSQLFGFSKGSFTGAIEDRAGLVEKANGGILFLDEIHRLPPQGQEILFRIIDKGEFNRVGDSNTRKVNLMIIGATTENIASKLLETFRRRIPVIIELPSLEERPLSERLELIKEFFTRESLRINKEILIPQNIVKSLLIYKCPGNVGQLKSDIQVICARAFLNSLSNDEQKIHVMFNDLPVHIRRQFHSFEGKDYELEMLNIKDLVVKPQRKTKGAFYSDSLFKYNIYEFIENRLLELKRQNNYDELKMKEILAKELERLIKLATNNIEKLYSGISKKLLQDIVGEEIVKAVEDIKELIFSELGVYDLPIFNILCLHLHTAIDRIRGGKPIINPQLEEIRNKYPNEYRTAQKILNMLELKLGLKFPEDEAGFIALYLSSSLNKSKMVSHKKVGVIIVTHGEVSKAMLDIAQSITGVKHGIAITMGLDEKPEEIFKKTKEAVVTANEGAGVILLVDMGSLVNFGKIITEELGIPTRTIARVDSLMVIEAIRKAVLPSATLDSVYDSLLELDKVLPRCFHTDHLNQNARRPVILTTCITGKGSAMQIKRIIEEKLRFYNKEIEIIPLGLIDEVDLAKRIKELQREKEIVLIVGAINPRCEGIPFISIDEFLESDKFEVLIETMKFKLQPLAEKEPAIKLKDLFDEKLVRIFNVLTSKEEIIYVITKTMEKEGYVENEFFKDVMDREIWSDSYIGGEVAIPHASITTKVIRPCIGIAIMKNPIEWENNPVSIVFVLALKSEHKELFMEFYNVIKETDIIQKLKNCENNKQVIEVVQSYVSPK